MARLKAEGCLGAVCACPVDSTVQVCACPVHSSLYCLLLSNDESLLVASAHRRAHRPTALTGPHAGHGSRFPLGPSHRGLRRWASPTACVPSLVCAVLQSLQGSPMHAASSATTSADNTGIHQGRARPSHHF